MPHAIIALFDLPPYFIGRRCHYAAPYAYADAAVFAIAYASRRHDASCRQLCRDAIFIYDTPTAAAYEATSRQPITPAARADFGRRHIAMIITAIVSPHEPLTSLCKHAGISLRQLTHDYADDALFFSFFRRFRR